MADSAGTSVGELGRRVTQGPVRPQSRTSSPRRPDSSINGITFIVCPQKPPQKLRQAAWRAKRRLQQLIRREVLNDAQWRRKRNKYQRAWLAKNRDKRNAGRRAWWARKKAEQNARRRKLYQRRPETQRQADAARKQAWALAYPEKIVAAKARFKEKKRCKPSVTV